MRMIRRLAIVAMLLWVIAAGARWLLRHSIVGEIERIHEKESLLCSTPIANAVGRELAILAATRDEHPDWFEDGLEAMPPWLPRMLDDFEPSGVSIREDALVVSFGGGFYDYGYWLEPAGSDEADGRSTWILSFYRSESESDYLGSFSVAPEDVLTPSRFTQRLTAGEERRGLKHGSRQR